VKRSVTVVQIGDPTSPKTRHRLRIDDEPSVQGSQEARVRLVGLIQAVADQPALLSCGVAYPERISITHNGSNWVLEGEAVVSTDPT
jgi:hypothetical protein